ncbi:LysR family transcriptional regulator [Kineococcus sp. T13]|uniref:LysR family transcriptional regulator n=1 Tax=Kineococcus vitellinus TaxID=2696565 RepID=UPI001411F955|nr:LysR family transcriptional regulator [Kineococcus vitellinus]NAZ75407.1 LysR family transcriptional regulator [Kineococcus vitellinus]
MSSRLSVDDLQLVEATARHGSVGAAARELLMTQPSASRRLLALERRLGTTLFERDTTGARASAAGRALARRAARLLAELDVLPEEVLAALEAPSLAVGSIQALSPMVFTAVEIELGGRQGPPVSRVAGAPGGGADPAAGAPAGGAAGAGEGALLRPEVDHGPVLVQRVHEGVLDAAFVTIAEQSVLPRGLQRTRLGESPLVLVLPGGAADLAEGARPLAGRTVLHSTIDLAGQVLHRRLSALGALPRPGATIETSLRLARHLRCPAVVPRFAARWYAARGDRLLPSPVPWQVGVWMVSRPPRPAVLTEALPRIAERVLGAG